MTCGLHSGGTRFESGQEQRTPDWLFPWFFSITSSHCLLSPNNLTLCSWSLWTSLKCIKDERWAQYYVLFYVTGSLVFISKLMSKWTALAHWVWQLSMGWTVRGSNPFGGESFLNRPDRSWDPPSLLYNGYRVSFTGVKRSGRGVNHQPPSSTEVKERVKLFLYSLLGPSCTILGQILSFKLMLNPLCFKNGSIKNNFQKM